MSDFDTVLERLLIDQTFARALAANPAAALAGYRLAPDEVALLHSQVSGDTGGHTTVENRTSKSSVFGLLSPLSGISEAVDALGDAVPDKGFGAATDPGGNGGGADFGSAIEARQGFGVAEAGQGFGAASAAQGFGAAEAGQGFGPASAARGLGGAGFGEAGRVDAPGTVAEPLPDGYRTRVDTDGDGRWDQHTLHGRPGGVDIVVDTDGDGRADFVGHDDGADSVVDSAEYDRDGDGHFEQRWYDDDGDGLLDRREDGLRRE